MSILEKAAGCFTSARRKLLEGAKYLHEIKEKELWKESNESYSEFLGEKCQISDGFASKLVQVYDHFVLKGGVDQKELETVDAEKLYLALKLPGKPEKQFSQALTLSRGELKNELNDPNDTCTHEEKITICAGCHKRV